MNVSLATGLASLLDALHVELVTTGYAWADPEVSSDGRVATWLAAVVGASERRRRASKWSRSAAGVRQARRRAREA